MKNLFLSAMLLLSGLFSSAQSQLVVDPDAEMRTLTGSFHSINVSGGIDLYLSQSSTEAIAVSASEEKYKAGIRTVVENNILKIYFDGERGISLKNKKIKAYVSFKDLQLIDVSGASDVIIAGKIVANDLTVKMSGASDLHGAVEVGSLKLELIGASDVSLRGKAGRVTINTAGASDVKAAGLITDYCDAVAAGASDIEITVNKELSARASGSSEISYKGDAVLKEIHKTGSSSVSRKG